VGRLADSEQSSFSVSVGVERCSDGDGASQLTKKVTATISMAVAIILRVLTLTQIS
jgi:hypothetical protein